MDPHVIQLVEISAFKRGLNIILVKIISGSVNRIIETNIINNKIEKMI